VVQVFPPGNLPAERTDGREFTDAMPAGEEKRKNFNDQRSNIKEAPSTRFQAPKKHQTPNGRKTPRNGPTVPIETWDLKIL
jgi:hypothetical protein